MKCKQVRDLMGAYLYGDLGPNEMRELRLHTQQCAPCREDLASQGQVTSGLSDAVPVLTDEERQRIAWSVKGAVTRNQFEPRPTGFRLTYGLALATVLLVGIGIGKLVGSYSTLPPDNGPKGRRVHILPQARVQVKEIPQPDDTSATDKIRDSLLDQSGNVIGTIGQQIITRGPSDRHLPSRGPVTTPQEDKVQAVPDTPAENTEKTNTDTATQESVAKPETPAPTESGDTKLPKVDDLKNAETKPSNP